MKRSKKAKAGPKFRVGQVVRHNGTYRMVSAMEFYAPVGQWRYYFGGRQYPFFEIDLHALTARESGQRQRKGKGV